MWYLKLTGELLNLPGANPAEAGLPMDGWERTWEKADIFDWDTLLSLEVDPPLGINSLAVGFGVFLLWEMLRAPKSLNKDEAGEVKGSGKQVTQVSNNSGNEQG